MSNFKQPVFQLGTVGSKAVVNWEFEVKPEITVPIEYVETGCGCTVMTDCTGTRIKGHINIASAGTFTEQNNTLSKVLKVCFDDGKNEFIPNRDRKKILNRDKLREVITLTGKVIPPKP